MMTTLSRWRGALLGLAVGDALGMPLEFQAPGSFTPLTGMVGGGPHNLQPGQWTDDTSMAICLAESLVERRGFDPQDQMERYVRWQQEGYRSSTGVCFDIGNTVKTALDAYARSGDPYSGPTHARSAGNGSLMRLAPVPMFFASNPQAAIDHAALSSRTTHGATEAVDACRYFAGLIIAALQGHSKQRLLSKGFSLLGHGWGAAPLAPRIAAIAAGSFREKQPPAIRGTGYVVESLEAALWAFASSDTFEEGALLAVNLGDDADTTGAVFGQLAGAYYGEAGIPKGWREQLAARDHLVGLAERLYAFAHDSETPQVDARADTS